MKERKKNYMESIPCARRIKKTRYYDIPTQVKFFDFDSEEPYWIGGIAFQDVIICGCCGTIIEISDLYDDAEETGLGEDPIKILRWIDISDEIKGE